MYKTRIVKPQRIPQQAYIKDRPITINCGDLFSGITVQHKDCVDSKQIYSWGNKSMMGMKSLGSSIRGDYQKYKDGTYMRGPSTVGI